MAAQRPFLCGDVCQKVQADLGGRVDVVSGSLPKSVAVQLLRSSPRMQRKIALVVAAMSGCGTPGPDVAGNVGAQSSCVSASSAIVAHGPSTFAASCVADLALTGDDVFTIDGRENGAVVKLPLAGDAGTKYVTVDAGTRVVREGEFVYWAGRDKIGRVDLAGSRKKILVSQNTPLDVRAMAADDTRLYFTTGDSVRSVPIVGGEVTTIATGGAPSGVAVDATHVYFTDANAGFVARVDKLGGVQQVISADRPAAGAIALDGDVVFFADSTSLVRMLKDGTDPLVLSRISDVRSLAVDSTHVYWTEGTTGSVRRVGKAGISPVMTLIASNEPGAPTSIAVDSTNVYWATGCSGVRRMPKADIAPSRCTDTPSVLTVADNVRALASYGTWVYFGTNGSIARTWRNGGLPETLAAGRGDIRRVVADRDGVYWAEKNGDAYTIHVLQNGAVIPRTLATAVDPDLALRDEELFFTDAAGAVKRVPKLGGEIATLATTDGAPRKMTSDRNDIVWSENLTGGGVRVRSVSILGGAVTTLATTAGGVAGPVAVDGGRVYFSAWSSPTGTVLSAPRTGGEVTVVASGAFGARELHAMDGSVWMTADGNTDIFRITASGATPLMQLAGGSHGLDADNFCAYFAVRHDDGTGAIRKVSRTTPGIVSEGQELIYEANLEPLNSNDFTKIAPVHGTARFTLKGDMFTVTINATGVVPGVTHPQHLHGARECSTPDADTNHDGFIDVVESLRVSNGVILTLDENLTYLPMEQAFPSPSAEGVLSWSSSASVSELEAVMGETLRLETRAVMLHGVDKDYVFPSTVQGVEGVPPHRNIPVACGLVKRVQ